MEQPHYYPQDMPPHQSPWMEQSSSHQHQHIGFVGHHHSPIHEYSNFGFNPALAPHDPNFHHPHTRPTHQQLQPLITTPWPSALATQNSYASQHPLPPPPPQLQHSPHSGPPLSAGFPPQSAHPHPLAPAHSGGHPSNTPRRTLTDSDRRKMCVYHEEHPTKKQTEIGEIFGVERSTVSKVLRQKEKYLNLNDGSQSPVKKAKKYPDIERTLAKWATNQQSKGVPVTDELLKHQAKTWWVASGNSGDMPIKVDSPGWLEKFRQKHMLNSTKQRKSSIKSLPSPQLGSPTSPGAQSRTDSPLHIDPPSLNRQDSASLEGLGIRSSRAPFHSQSNTSLSSAFTDQAPPFSSDGGSTAVSPDGLSSTSSYFAPAISTGLATNAIRPRSQTLPVGASGDAYISPPQSADPASPHYSAAAVAVFESPKAEMPPPPVKNVLHHSSHPPSSMHTTKSMPSLKAKSQHDADKLSAHPTLSDARRGLEAAMLYLNTRPSGWASSDLAALKRLMSQLKLQEAGSMPGGLHRIPEQEYGRSEEDIDMAAFHPAHDSIPMAGVTASAPQHHHPVSSV